MDFLVIEEVFLWFESTKLRKLQYKLLYGGDGWREKYTVVHSKVDVFV